MKVDPDRIQTVPDPVAPNQAFTVWYHVELDDGQEAAEQDCVNINGNGQDVTATADVAGVAPGGAYGSSANFEGLPAGEYWINILPGCNETAAGRLFVIGGNASFRVDTLATSPDRVGPNEGYTVRWMIVNEGTGNTAEDQYDYVRITDVSGSQVDEQWFQVPVTVPQSTYAAELSFEGREPGQYDVHLYVNARSAEPVYETIFFTVMAASEM
ncbi:MAG TPA: hypothetical protein VF855_11875 [Acidimicrobiales bacterium]